MVDQQWFQETLYPDWGQRFRIEKVLFEQKTPFFHLIIFENSQFGRVMALDGVIQTTESDEHVYHEMLTHVPLFAHGNAEQILIIGGGDGGILRETLKHPVQSATMVEIDRAVIDVSQRYLPNHSAGAFDDKRLNLVIDDGARFVTTDSGFYDVIIVDSTDPLGPGEVLFTQEFYQGCHQRLKPGGILVTQNGVPFLQKQELQNSHQRLSKVFQDVTFYTAAVPTYAGGLMTLGWATDNKNLQHTALKLLEERFKSSCLRTQYYTPQLHQASFALPAFVKKFLDF